MSDKYPRGGHGMMVTTRTLFCAGCMTWEDLEQHVFKLACKEAREHGWYYEKGNGWLCPECRVKHLGHNRDKIEKTIQDTTT